MGRHKNTNGTFVPAGLKIRFEIINMLYQAPADSIKIPSARELAIRFHLSPSTVTLELQKLIREGYLIGRRGSGTYTNPAKVHFIPDSINRKIIGILVGDGRQLIYNAIDWAMQSWAGMAFSPEVGYPRFITLQAGTSDGIYEELTSQNLSGLIWIHPDPPHREVMKKLIKNNFPIVAVNNETPDIPSISYSFFRSGEQMAECAAMENRHTIFFAPLNNSAWILQRKAGIEDYSRRHPEAGLILRTFSSIQECVEELEHACETGNIPDVLYGNGGSIFVLLDRLKKYGVDILDRCRLIAEEQHVLHSRTFHGYVLRYPFREIGEKAVAMLCLLLENPRRKFPVWYAEPEILFRKQSEPL